MFLDFEIPEINNINSERKSKLDHYTNELKDQKLLRGVLFDDEESNHDKSKLNFDQLLGASDYNIRDFNLNNQTNQNEANMNIQMDSSMATNDNYQSHKRRNDESKSGNIPKVSARDNNMLNTTREDSSPKNDTSSESILQNNNKKDLQGNIHYEDNLSNDQVNENISRLLDIMEVNAKQANNIGKSYNSFENEKFNDGNDNMVQFPANNDIGNLLDMMKVNPVHDNSMGKMHNRIEMRA